MSRPNAERRRWIRRRLASRDGARCFYCRQRFTVLAQATIDHLVPHCQIPGWKLANLVLACWACNQAKADRLPQEFLRPRGYRPGLSPCGLLRIAALLRTLWSWTPRQAPTPDTPRTDTASAVHDGTDTPRPVASPKAGTTVAASRDGHTSACPDSPRPSTRDASDSEARHLSVVRTTPCPKESTRRVASLGDRRDASETVSALELSASGGHATDTGVSGRWVSVSRVCAELQVSPEEWESWRQQGVTPLHLVTPDGALVMRRAHLEAWYRALPAADDDVPPAT